MLRRGSVAAPLEPAWRVLLSAAAASAEAAAAVVAVGRRGEAGLDLEEKASALVRPRLRLVALRPQAVRRRPRRPERLGVRFFFQLRSIGVYFDTPPLMICPPAPRGMFVASVPTCRTRASTFASSASRFAALAAASAAAAAVAPARARSRESLSADSVATSPGVERGPRSCVGVAVVVVDVRGCDRNRGRTGKLYSRCSTCACYIQRPQPTVTA